MHDSDINNNIDLINFIKRFRETVVLNSTDVYYCSDIHGSDRPTLVIVKKYKQSTNMLQNLEFFFYLYIRPYSSDGNLVIYPN